MKFTNVDHRNQYMEEESERVRLELVSLYKERDSVIEQIADQRKGKSIVFVETKDKKTELNGIEDILKETSIQLKKANKDFYKLTDNQKAKINKLTGDINNKLSEIDEYNKIELIDKEKENKKIKSLLNDKRKEVGVLDDKMYDMQHSIAEFEKYKTKESQKLDKQQKYQEDVKKALAKKTIDLNRKEKRLNKLHLVIKWDKNG